MKRATLLVMVLALVGCTTVPPGHKGIQVYFGELQDEVLEPGFYTSILTSIERVSVQVMATESVATATTNDLQNVTTTVTLNWSRDPAFVHGQYDKYPRIESRIIAPSIQESVKSITAQYTATELVTKRQLVKDAIESLIGERLTPIGIILDTLNITDFSFSEEFNDSIEAKVRAEQEALRAKEDLVKTKVIAQQAEEQARGEMNAALLKAEGEAQAIEIRGKALRNNPQVMELLKIERWNGKYPETLVMGKSDASFLISTGAK